MGQAGVRPGVGRVASVGRYRARPWNERSESQPHQALARRPATCAAAANGAPGSDAASKSTPIRAMVSAGDGLHRALKPR